MLILSQYEQEHASALSSVYEKCSGTDLQICPDKCVPVIYTGSNFKNNCSFLIGEGYSRNIFHVAAQFLCHTTAHSLSVQRKLSNKKFTNYFLESQ